MAMKLKEFIHAVRCCRTAEEERTVVAQESAAIRTYLKKGVGTDGYRQIAKLLFIHMMGYPTYFGQIECLRLIASSDFADKRIGYLALTQFINEDDEILMLVTNSIKNDLHHTNQYVNTLALIALANIGSAQMCQTLAPEVEALCLSTNQIVKRKAIVCAIRVVRKVEDVSERFFRILPTIMQEQNHGILLAGSSLICTLIKFDPTGMAPLSKEILPYLVSRLKNVVMMSGCSSNLESDVAGVCNPFLQTKLLEAIRAFYQINESQHDPTVVEVLAQVIVSTNSARNLGCAILVECVKTISCLKYDKALFSLCENVFVKFLQHKDNNIRYVGICCVQQLMKTYSSLFDQYADTITSCVQDGDSSIHRRALQVVLTMMNEKTFYVFIKQLIQMMENRQDTSLSYEDKEFLKDLTVKIISAVEEYSSTRRYQIDVLIHLHSICSHLHLATRVSSIMTLISVSPELQYYATLKLFCLAKQHLYPCTLLEVSLWALGEYSTVVVESTREHDVNQVTSDAIVNFLEECVKKCVFNKTLFQDLCNTGEFHTLIGISSLMYYGSQNFYEEHAFLTIAETLLNTLAKVATGFPDQLDRIKKLFTSFACHPNVELQQRSMEYSMLLDAQYVQERGVALGPIPSILEQKSDDERLKKIINRPIGNTTFDYASLSTNSNTLDVLVKSPTALVPRTGSNVDLLLFNDDTELPQTQNQVNSEVKQHAKLTDLFDLLDATSPPHDFLPNKLVTFSSTPKDDFSSLL